MTDCSYDGPQRQRPAGAVTITGMANVSASSIVTIINPDFTGITENIATTWAGDLRVGRISFRKLSGTEVRRINGREKYITVDDFYYVVTLLMDSGDTFDVADEVLESSPVGVYLQLQPARDLLEDIAARIEL